jgi:spore coat polysaccharide biosynthesis predicted glycosyltransferase SpsG
MKASSRVDILCDGNNKVGFGHIKRSLTLAAQLRLDGVDVRLVGLSEQAKIMLPYAIENTSEPEITIFDSPINIDEKISNFNKIGRFTIALDHFGWATPDVNIAVFEHQRVHALRSSYIGFEFILIREEIIRLRGSSPSGQASRVLVMVGGGDILGHGHIAAQILTSAGCDVTLIQGPFSDSSRQFTDYAILKNPSDLPELFVKCDWAVTSGGGSLFEGLCLGKAVHVLPQTSAESRIAQYVSSHHGILGLGLDSLRPYTPSEVATTGESGACLVDGLGALRISKIVKSCLLN